MKPVVVLLAFAAAASGQKVAVDTLPMASLPTRDGKTLLVLNAGRNQPSISVIDVATLRETSRTPVADAWLGMAFAPDESKLYVSGGSQAAIFEFTFAGNKLTPARTFAVVPPAARKPEDFIGDVKLSPDGRLLYLADFYRNQIVVINPQSGRVIERWQTGRRPYRILFHPDAKSFFVSSWADGSVYQHRATDGERLGVTRLAPQPMDMVLSSKPVQAEEEGDTKPVWKHRLFVAAANTNAVYVLGITEGGEMRLLETINIALSPRHPLGMTPTTLSLSADEKTLYAACSDANAVAVVAIDGAKSVVRGHVPSGGAYPTAVRELAGGDRIAILNGGDGSVGIAGALSDLTAYTKQVRAASPYSDATLDVSANPGAIENVVYIVRNPSGNAAAPNYEKLGREFALLDQIAPLGGSPVESLFWATSAIVPPFTRLLLPNHLGGRGRRDVFDGSDPAGNPAAGFLWSNAASAGLTIRNYGFAVQNRAAEGPDGSWVQTVKDPGLARYTNRDFAGPGAPGVTDVDRAEVFVDDIPELARLSLIRLAAADQDAALGQIVKAISEDRAHWTKTVIFVVDAATGPSKGLVISPYTRLGGKPDPTPYTQTSVLRTIELLLGLKPMTQFDAAATPISGIFSAKGDPAPYVPAKN